MTLPALRLSGINERLRQLDDQLPITEIMAIVIDELEHGTRRVGNLCPIEGCLERAESNGQSLAWRSYQCPVHGHIPCDRGAPLLVAFDPYVSKADRR